MVATTTRSISSLRKKIFETYPQFTFSTNETACWSPRENTVYYSDRPSWYELAVLLHELGHALLDHQGYHQDIELVAMEQSAWLKAESLASELKVKLDQSIIDDHLDTYRDWLHARSRCPQCQQAGIQQIDLAYRCVIC